MLLRSSSTPMLNSLLPQSSPEPEFFQQITSKSKTCPIPTPLSIHHDHIKKVSRNLSESDLVVKGSYTTKGSSCMNGIFLVPVEDEEEEEYEQDMRCKVAEVAFGRGGGDWSGAGNGSLGGGGGDGGGYGWCWDANNGNSSMDLHYEQMIEADPGNSMLLSNYARFLKEFDGDYVKAEEYCGRAILANPKDADALTQYANLIWQTNEDAKRADIYFDRAVKAAPDDSNVMASYAHFLWDAEDQIEDQ